MEVGNWRLSAAEYQELRDTIIERCDKISEKCSQLEARMDEHEAMWAAIAPKMVRLDEVLERDVASPPLGGASVLDTKESISSQQAKKGSQVCGRRITRGGGSP